MKENLSYEENESIANALAQLEKVAIVKVFIFNNRYSHITINSKWYMEKWIKNINPLYIENKDLLHMLETEEIEMKMVEGFRTRKEAVEYVREKLHHTTLVDKLLIEMNLSTYAVVIQKDPITNKVLNVYPGSYDIFAKCNRLILIPFAKAITENKIYNGYKWETGLLDDWDLTTLEPIYKDPLNVGPLTDLSKKAAVKYVVKAKKSLLGKNVGKPKVPVTILEISTNIETTYPSKAIAAKALDADVSRINKSLKDGCTISRGRFKAIK